MCSIDDLCTIFWYDCTKKRIINEPICYFLLKKIFNNFEIYRFFFKLLISICDLYGEIIMIIMEQIIFINKLKFFLYLKLSFFSPKYFLLNTKRKHLRFFF